LYWKLPCSSGLDALSAGLGKQQKFSVSSALPAAALSTSHGRNGCAETPHSKGGKRLYDSLKHGRRGLVIKPPFTQMLTPLGGVEFVVRLDERDDFSLLGKPPPSSRQGVTLWSPPEVDCDQINSFRRRVLMQGIGPFTNFNAWVLPKRPRKCSVSGVHCDDRASASVQQAVGETSDIAAEIRAPHTSGVDLKDIKRVPQFSAGS
jgi:hypothetical protein